jgi:hypothetical protein
MVSSQGTSSATPLSEPLARARHGMLMLALRRICHFWRHTPPFIKTISIGMPRVPVRGREGERAVAVGHQQ